jgi:hypothetical protein
MLRTPSSERSRRSSKSDDFVTDDESPIGPEVNEDVSMSPASPAIHLDGRAELESVLIEEVPKTPSKPDLKYNFQDPTGPKGQMYRGEFQHAKKHGTGAMCFARDDPECRFMYKGDFIDDKMEGSGVLDWHDGKSYKGQFENNRLHGEGVLTWPDGCKYIGHYAEGRKHGLGTIQYSDGSRYCGPFVKGKMHGEVVYTNKHGIEKLIRYRQGRAMHYSVTVLGEGAASDATTDVSRELSSAGSSFGATPADSRDHGNGIASLLAEMHDGETLGVSDEFDDDEEGGECPKVRVVGL